MSIGSLGIVGEVLFCDRAPGVLAQQLAELILERVECHINPTGRDGLTIACAFLGPRPFLQSHLSGPDMFTQTKLFLSGLDTFAQTNN